MASMWDVFVDQVHLSVGAVPDVQMAQPLNNLKNVSVDSRRNSDFRYRKVETGMLLAPNRHHNQDKVVAMVARLKPCSHSWRSYLHL